MSGQECDVVICRVCLSECIDYKSIHRQGIVMSELTTLSAMLTYCTSLDFPVNEDFMPSNMCNPCIANLAKLYIFKKNLIKANETLRVQQVHLQNTGVSELQEVPPLHTTDRELQDWHDSTESSAADQQKQEIEHSYVTLTVMEDNKEEANMIQIEHDNNDTEEEEITTQHNDDDGDTQSDQEQYNEVMEDEEKEAVYQQREIELEQYKVEEDDCENDTYVIIVQDAISNGDGTGLSTSEPEEVVLQQHVVAQTTDKRKLETPWTDLVAAKRSRMVKQRNKRCSEKTINPNLQCTVCSKQLSNPTSFRYHMQLHSDATPFLCSLCGEGFKTRNAYGGHMSLHDPNNPNTCEICGKAYRQPSSLRAHMLSHTGERPFKCDICGKGMTQKSGYKKHMLTHTGEKPHTCDICGRDFRYSSNLISHKRHHTGEKPYDCSLCEKRFSTTEQLKRHTLVHTGERPFGCEVCSRRFNRRSTLVAHRQTHEANRAVLKNETAEEGSKDEEEEEEHPKQVKCIEHY